MLAARCNSRLISISLNSNVSTFRDIDFWRKPLYSCMRNLVLSLAGQIFVALSKKPGILAQYLWYSSMIMVIGRIYLIIYNWSAKYLWNSQIFVEQGQIFTENDNTGPNIFDNLQKLVIVTHIWQKLSTVERQIILIVTNIWQLLSQIFGETLLIATNIWRNSIRFSPFC